MNSGGLGSIVVLAVCTGAATAATIYYRQSWSQRSSTAFCLPSMVGIFNVLISSYDYGETLPLLALGWRDWPPGRDRFSGLPTCSQPLGCCPTATVIVLGAILLALCVCTLVRNADRPDDRSLWSSAARVSRNSYKVYQHLVLLALEKPGGWSRPVPKSTRRLRSWSALRRKTCHRLRHGRVLLRTKGAGLAPEAAVAWYQSSLELLLEGRRQDQA